MVELFVIVFGRDGAGGLFFAQGGPELVVLEFDLLEPVADFGDVADSLFFGLPLFAEVGQLVAQLFHFGFDFLAAVDGVLFGLFGQLPLGQLQLHQPPLHLIDFGRHAFQLHGQPAGGFVHQVDGLVGQEAIGDVAVRQIGRGDQGRVLDFDPLVVGLVAGLEPAQDGDRVFDVRFADEDRLEAALQGGVFLDVFAILVQRRGADAAQFAAGQRRLEQIGGVVAPFGRSGADDGVQFVDEQNHVAAGGFDFAEHGFESLFEFAAEFGAGDQRAHVERDDALVLQALRHVPFDDAQGQSFGDGGLADAGLADQHGIILRAAREDLDHAADFLIAADDRVELALGGPFDQIDAITFQRVEFFFRVLIGDAGAAADRLQGLEHDASLMALSLRTLLALESTWSGRAADVRTR